MGCSSVSDAHIYMHHVSSVRDWWKKNELGCSWDVQDAQDALKTDPFSISKLSYLVGKCRLCHKQDKIRKSAI